MLGERMPLPVLTEESGEHGGVRKHSRMWVVDPLDGTFNYSRGMPLCCSSVGLWEDGRARAGGGLQFLHGRIVHGHRGAGGVAQRQAHRGFGRARRRRRRRWRRGFRTTRTSPTRRCGVRRQVQSFKKIRMLGTAALMGAYVACGWLDAYVEEDIWLWDVAAAAAICQAAGAAVRIRPGQAGRWAREVVLAASPELLQVLEEGTSMKRRERSWACMWRSGRSTRPRCRRS
jgi:myo-inositol-1(or 4)-monophosphatase